jgi:hypothetical protein
MLEIEVGIENVMAVREDIRLDVEEVTDDAFHGESAGVDLGRDVLDNYSGGHTVLVNRRFQGLSFANEALIDTSPGRGPFNSHSRFHFCYRMRAVYPR